MAGCVRPSVRAASDIDPHRMTSRKVASCLIERFIEALCYNPQIPSHCGTEFNHRQLLVVVGKIQLAAIAKSFLNITQYTFRCEICVGKRIFITVLKPVKIIALHIFQEFDKGLSRVIQ
jgi:hypothetical protein